MIPWYQTANTKYLIVQDDSKYQIPDCSGLFCRLIRDSGICCDEETKFSWNRQLEPSESESKTDNQSQVKVEVKQTIRAKWKWNKQSEPTESETDN